MIILFLAYQALSIAIFPIFLCFLITRKMKKKPVFGSLSERLGFVPKNLTQSAKTVWFHAVSVGEVLSIQSIIEKIKKNSPTTICYLTVGTKTGKNMAKKNIPADYISFLPYDFLPTMLLAYKRIKPTNLIIVEAEIWPNLLMLSKFKKIPACSINSRISKRSKNRYKLLIFFILPLLNIFEKIYTQSENDKLEFGKLGIKSEKLSVLGNIKTFNVLEKQKKLSIEKNATNKTLLVGSIHPGEIDFYINLFKKLKQKNKIFKIIIAPRHFFWKKELIEKVKATKFSYFVWDEENNFVKNGFDQNNFDILLVCKLGELFKLYSQATLYFLGGTFVPIGGHNLLEPAVWGNPTIIGPHHENCAETAKELIKNDALIAVKDEAELIKATEHLLDNQEKLLKMGEEARKWLERESAVVEEKFAEIFQNILS